MPPLADGLFHSLQIVTSLYLFFLQIDFCTSSNGKNRLVQHRVACKNLVYKLLNNILQQNKFRLVLGEIYYPAHTVRQRNNTKNQLFLPLENSRYIQLFIIQMRERMMLIYNLRRQHWQDTILKNCFQLLILLFGQLMNIYMANALFQQLAAEISKNPISLNIQLPHLVKNCMKLFRSSHHAFIIPLFRVHSFQAQQTAYSNHKEFIQIAGKNLHKFQPLAKRHRAIISLLQHPLVEFQPGQLPILGIGCHQLLILQLQSLTH